MLPLRVLWILWFCQESVISNICSNKSKYGRISYVYENATCKDSESNIEETEMSKIINKHNEYFTCQRSSLSTIREKRGFSQQQNWNQTQAWCQLQGNASLYSRPQWERCNVLNFENRFRREGGLVLTLNSFSVSSEAVLSSMTFFKYLQVS